MALSVESMVAYSLNDANQGLVSDIIIPIRIFSLFFGYKDIPKEFGPNIAPQI
jgi:hypothetical protein